MSRLTKLLAFLDSEPDDSFTRYAVGLEYAKTENFAEAIRTLEDLRTRDPKYVPTYYMLASYYRQTNDRLKASEAYQAGLANARSAGDLHAASELQSALDELEDES